VAEDLREGNRQPRARTLALFFPSMCALRGNGARFLTLFVQPAMLPFWLQPGPTRLLHSYQTLIRSREQSRWMK
jgi:hypothetical protein